MALVTHQMQGSCASFPARSVPRNKVLESKQVGRTVSVVQFRGTDNFISLQCKYIPVFRVGAPFFLGPAKLLKVTSFKGPGQSEDSSEAFGSKSLKNSVKLSYVQQESEEALTELPQDVSSSATDESTEGAQAIHSLFRNWLGLLRTPLPSQVVDEALKEPSSGETTEMHNKLQKKGSNEILKAVWYSFWGLDAVIKIPILIFVPFFLVINVIHGEAVSKELTPLWILGPVIVALYVKMFRAICALYVYAFKQTVKVVKSVPTYYAMASNFSSPGKLKKALFDVLDAKNLDVKKVSARIKKDLSDWLMEKYLDFIESIWPTYCRTIRFLKRANLL